MSCDLHNVLRKRCDRHDKPITFILKNDRALGQTPKGSQTTSKGFEEVKSRVRTRNFLGLFD